MSRLLVTGGLKPHPRIRSNWITCRRWSASAGPKRLVLLNKVSSWVKFDSLGTCVLVCTTTRLLERRSGVLGRADLPSMRNVPSCCLGYPECARCAGLIDVAYRKHMAMSANGRKGQISLERFGTAVIMTEFI
jgi:hypothetical protein